ncbi:MAG: hypothetical protein LQ340_006009, partial [Diploschistes diacapsis]
MTPMTFGPAASSRQESSATLVDQQANNQDGSSQSANKQRKLVRFEHGDPENPYNWSSAKKIYILLTGILSVLNSTLGSSLPAGITPLFPSIFSLSPSNTLILSMPITTYLLGYVLAPLLFGPLSETYGRRPVMLYTFLSYTLFTLLTPFSPNYTALNIFRFLTGLSASAPIAVTGGIYADIFSDPVVRGRAMAAFMASTAFGPTIVGPLISGYLGLVSWKLPFFTALAIAGITLPPLFLMPETYGPLLLLRRARHLRKTNPSAATTTTIFAPLELEAGSPRDIATRVLTRPFRMFFTEKMVLFTCLYTALIYAIFYLYFEAYPLIFQTASPSGYNLSAGPASLTFVPISAGSILSFPIFIAYDAYLRRAQRLRRKWAARYEARRLPLAFIGGPLISASIFWLALTSDPGRFSDPVLPALAGLPYGVGFVLIFMALLNYLTDAY